MVSGLQVRPTSNNRALDKPCARVKPGLLCRGFVMYKGKGGGGVVGFNRKVDLPDCTWGGGGGREGGR